jgi:septum formation protein
VFTIPQTCASARSRYHRRVKSNRSLILASSSVRRKALLEALELPFAVLPAAIEEVLAKGATVEEGVLALAVAKAAAVAPVHPFAHVLAADTLVAVEGAPLGKPANAAEARDMLERLRGRRHWVHTGLCLCFGGETRRALVSTQVEMRAFSDEEIEATIAAGTPFDKAGAYAIQDPSFAPVERIEGCYCNVMGLPLWTVRAMLLGAQAGFVPAPPDQLRPVCAACPLRASDP